MSIVMVGVMGWSMWNDTHPEWRKYQEQYASVERKVLLAKKADLERQINHPDYVGDYNKAKQDYLASKSTFDSASDAMDQTQADLEEIGLEMNPSGEEGGGGAASEAGGGAASAQPTTQQGKASDADMAELDKEMGGGGAPPSGGGAAAGAAAGGGASAKASPQSSQPSQSDLAELDKEMSGSGAPKSSSAPEKSAGDKSSGAKSAAQAAPTGGQASDADMAELDKEMSGPGAPAKSGGAGQATPGGKGEGAGAKPAAGPGGTAQSSSGNKDMDELDKEFASDKAPKPTVPEASTGAAAATPADMTLEEADFKVDEAGAEKQVEDAHRDLLLAERKHNKEMIGLPADADLKRKQADTELKQAQETLTLSMDNLDLQRKMQEVKTAAQIVRWSQDAQTLKTFKSTGSPSDVAKLQALQQSQSNLDAHISDLQRDLRLVNQRLDRNRTQGPAIEQTYIERLGVVDRCATCHKATDDPMFADQSEPFKTHPGDLLKWHPVEKFGCSSCHGGSGAALGKFEAHGGLVGKGRPLLVGDQVQASCGKCHGESKELPGMSTFLSGAQLFKSSGCLGCHKVEGIDTPAKAGPGLDRVDEKVGATWLIGWLMDPRSHSLEARMPNFGLTSDQATDVAAFLLTQHGQAPTSDLPPVPSFPADKIAQGNDLVHKLGCLGCHSIRGEGNFVGPELTNVGNKVRPDWMYGWLQNPRSYLPDAKMPNFGLSRDEAVAIGDYLLSLATPKKPAVTFTTAMFNDAAARQGAEIISQRGCAGCHSIKGFDKLAAPELTHEGDKTADIIDFGNNKTVGRNIYDYMVEKIENPNTYDTDKLKAKMPRFGLDKEESAQIAVYLLSRTSTELPPEYIKDATEPQTPLSAGRQIFTEHNCIGCHTINGVGAKIGPDLTREGEKVKPTWLFGFLERPVRIRWWQQARMPNFSLSEQEASTITQYLEELSNQPEPYEYTPPEKLTFPLAPEGATHFADLKCESCHPLNGQQKVAGGGDTKKLGPDLAMASSRLKPDWMLRFLRNPQAYTPGTPMPTFKQSDHTYQSIIDFLMKQHQQ